MKALVTGCVGFVGSHLAMSWVRIEKFIIYRKWEENKYNEVANGRSVK